MHGSVSMKIAYISRMTYSLYISDLQDLCEFLSGKHQLTKVSLVGIPIRVMAAALSTESSTLKELDCIYTMNVRILLHALH